MVKALRIYQESDIDERLDAAIKETLCICFPSSTDVFSRTRAWYDCALTWSFVIDENESIIAHLALVDRIITVDELPVKVAGVSGVCVRPQYRGRGLCRKLLSAAMRKARELHFDLGMLCANEAVAGVYAVCGWQVLNPITVIRIDENGRDVLMPSETVTMFYPLLREQFPPGIVHLQGNDW